MTVLLSGIGIATSDGLGRDALANLVHGRSQSATDRGDSRDAEQAADLRATADLPLVTRLSIGAATEAWTEAGAVVSGVEASRIGLYAGSTNGLLRELEAYEADLATRAFAAARPSVYQELTLGALTGHVSIALQTRGPILPLNHGWLSTYDALEFAIDDLMDEVVDAALLLGVDVAESTDDRDTTSAPPSVAVALVLTRAGQEADAGLGAYGSVLQGGALRASSPPAVQAALRSLLATTSDACGGAIDVIVGTPSLAVDAATVCGDAQTTPLMLTAPASIGSVASCDLLLAVASLALHGARETSRAGKGMACGISEEGGVAVIGLRALRGAPCAEGFVT